MPFRFFQISFACFLLSALLFISCAAQQDSIKVHRQKGIELYNEHDDTGEALLEAKKEFETVLSFDKADPPALAYLGFIAMEESDSSTAKKYFQQALTLDSTCAEAHVGMERLFRMRGEWEAGNNELRTAIRLEPTSLFARRELASLLIHGAEQNLDENRLHEAIPHLEYLVDADSNDRDAHYDLATSFEFFHQWDSALVHYRTVFRIGQTPEDMDVWVYMVQHDVARCLENLGRYEEALTEYQQYLSVLESMQADTQTLWVIRSNVKRLMIKLKR